MAELCVRAGQARAMWLLLTPPLAKTNSLTTKHLPSSSPSYPPNLLPSPSRSHPFTQHHSNYFASICPCWFYPLALSLSLSLSLSHTHSFSLSRFPSVSLSLSVQIFFVCSLHYIHIIVLGLMFCRYLFFLTNRKSGDYSLQFSFPYT